MSNCHPNAVEPDQKELSALAHRLFSSNPDIDILRAYFDAAKQTRNLNHAKQTLEALQKRYPANHNIRSLFIVICLQQNDLSAAMDAIETLVAFSKPDDDLIDSSLSVRHKIGPREINQNRTDGPTLSVCMVVKNEQASLGPCLNAVKAIANEIVVIDTGSVDRSPDIARIFGARVFSFDWKDDFSAARNYALQNARADWVLILDADEIIAGRDLIVLKNRIQSCRSRQVAFSIETRNYTNVANSYRWQANSGQYPLQEAGLGWFPSVKIRLFPRSPDISFHYPVHELVEPSVKAAGLQIVQSNIPIHHYGHLNETKNKAKAQSYFKIGYAKLEQLGQDFSALRELAVQAGQLEYWSEALELWHRLIQIKPDFVEAYVNMAGICWQTRSYQNAFEFAQQALKIDPMSKEAHFNMAISRLMLGRADLAAAILSRLLVKHDGYLAAKFMLGAACCASGDAPRGCSILMELAASPAGPALGMAIRDLTQRLQKTGLDKYADSLTQCATTLRQMEKEA